MNASVEGVVLEQATLIVNERALDPAAHDVINGGGFASAECLGAGVAHCGLRPEFSHHGGYVVGGDALCDGEQLDAVSVQATVVSDFVTLS